MVYGKGAISMPSNLQHEFERVVNNRDAVRELGVYAVYNEWKDGESSWDPPDFLGGEPAPLNPDMEPPGEGRYSLDLPKYIGEKVLAAAA
jgi:hypothetical protein